MSEAFHAEPFRIKVVEPVRRTTREERARLVQEAGYNLFHVPSEAVYVDLLTDSGTGAMSDRQWAGLMLGDEAYAGSRNFRHLEDTVRRLLGFEHVIPTHQGRGAEHVLFSAVLREGQYVLNNMHFDTTRAHVQYRKCVPLDLAIAEAYNPTSSHPFKGNFDLDRLEAALAAHGDKVALVLATVTCNTGGGQPVSLDNLERTSAIAARHGVPFFLDACRFAENAFFIQEREPGWAGRPLGEIVRAMMDCAAGCTMSGKKDALVNIGGFLALRDPEVYRQAMVWAVLFEGFPTYGGLAGRDLEAMARGLEEVVDDDYLRYRVGQVRRLAGLLLEAGVPIMEPPGGHAVYLDVRRFLPHLDQDQLPGQSLAVELYLEGGVRGVEIGTVLAGRDPATGENYYPRLELVRLAIPRRVYTDRHLDWVAQTVCRVHERRGDIKGLAFDYEPPVLRHFTATFRPLA
ncbi:MAG: tryptophanase [bacterium]|nr:tryptophanase [bacterium]